MGDGMERRCGVPYQHTYREGKKEFYLINARKEATGSADEVLTSSFFC